MSGDVGWLMAWSFEIKRGWLLLGPLVVVSISAPSPAPACLPFLSPFSSLRPPSSCFLVHASFALSLSLSLALALALTRALSLSPPPSLALSVSFLSLSSLSHLSLTSNFNMALWGRFTL